jgi:hypothetical protein
MINSTIPRTIMQLSSAWMGLQAIDATLSSDALSSLLPRHARDQTLIRRTSANGRGTAVTSGSPPV